MGRGGRNGCRAKSESEEGCGATSTPYFRGYQAGYLGQVSQGKDSAASGPDDDTLVRSPLIHGSLATVAARIENDLSARLCCTIQPGTPWRANASPEPFAPEFCVVAGTRHCPLSVSMQAICSSTGAMSVCIQLRE